MGGQQYAHIGINAPHGLALAADWPQAKLLALQQWCQIVPRRGQYPSTRLLKACGALRPMVAMQATQTLQKYIHGAQIGDEQICVNVQALL